MKEIDHEYNNWYTILVRKEIEASRPKSEGKFLASVLVSQYWKFSISFLCPSRQNSQLAVEVDGLRITGANCSKSICRWQRFP